jgi:endo-1,4-beta-mannosidase
MGIKLLIFFLFSLPVFALNIGFNQAWFHNNYSTQYLDKKFDIAEVERVFKLASSAGSKTIRLWFFEGKKMPMINWDGETPVSLKREYVDNVISLLRIAIDNNIKVYMTLFDAHSYTGDKK